jgi:hypothetical protein
MTGTAHRSRKWWIAGVIVVVSAAAWGAMPSSAQASCRTFEHRAKMESSVFNTDLAYLNIEERACYSGKRITKVYDLVVSPSFTDNSLGTISFDGLDSTPTEEYRTWHHRRHGSYYVRAGGNFTQSFNVPFVPDAHCHMWASMRILGSGRVIKDRDNC